MRNGGRGKDRVVLLVGKEGKQRGGDMREIDEKNEWRDERGREEGKGGTRRNGQRQITMRIANANKTQNK